MPQVIIEEADLLEGSSPGGDNFKQARQQALRDSVQGPKKSPMQIKVPTEINTMNASFTELSQSNMQD